MSARHKKAGGTRTAPGAATGLNERENVYP